MKMNTMKMKYRIQHRKFSSNIIESSLDGKTWTPFLAPLIKKEDGDKLTEKLIDKL